MKADSVVPEIVTRAPEHAAFRQDLHAHPELSYQEERTAEQVAQKLAEWGIRTHRGLGKTGVVGIIQAGSSTRALGLRADMDALPMQEFNTFTHASKYSGKMHACGHDGHTAMLLAAAQHLAQHREFDGTVYLIFQPAEEAGAGADAMIRDGLFERFSMDAVFGMHNWPGMEVGTFALSPGPVMASSNTFSITIVGRGCHAAMPHNGVDPVVVAASLVQGFQSIISRSLRPIDAGVISVTKIHAGEAINVIPERCELQGTVRAFSLEVLDLIERRMRTLSDATAQAFGATCEFTFKRNYPPTINHPAETAFARKVLAELVGPEQVRTQEPTMGAEDFAFMLLKKPGAYCFIGNGEGGHRLPGHGEGPCMLHNPSYDFNDALIPLGASYWVKLVQSWLA
jgi:amidohydrolase